jgi:hypothetical protein
LTVQSIWRKYLPPYRKLIAFGHIGHNTSLSATTTLSLHTVNIMSIDASAAPITREHLITNLYAHLGPHSSLENTKLALEVQTQLAEADKSFLEKWDQLVTHSLYISIGVFGIFPTVLSSLRGPYRYPQFLWFLTATGVLAIVGLAVSKSHFSGYYRRLFRQLRDFDYSELKLQPSTFILVQSSLIMLCVEVICFIAFIAINLTASFQEPPRFAGIQASSLVVTPGTPVTLQANATDRDQDILEYDWQASGGTLIGKKEPTATWVAPDSIKDGETFQIEAAVGDGHSRVIHSTTVIVRESEEVRAGIDRLCLMAAPLEPPSKPVPSTTSFEGRSEVDTNTIFQHTGFRTIPVVDTNFTTGPACERLSAFVEQGQNEQAKKNRIALAEKEIQSVSQNGRKASKDKWGRCCSTSLVPIFCNPNC